MATLTVNDFSTPAEVQAFLAQIASQNPDIAIIKKEIRSKNPAGRTRVFGPGAAADYDVCSVVANNQIRQFGTLFMIASNLNPLWEQTQAFQQKNGNSSWHYFGMMLIERTVRAINSFPSNPWLTRPPTSQTVR
ncbi:MAG: hypothetical protein FRX48_07997 [Lasallia pustulata]|uniref:Uncharacterized protein n=1 Tax=Lasallia pustulata TaxID=136370 RepID=A0A5M8PG66_9LECA|nr:MAG: hypothetical protein FRX48_07997 [Lasallia pustulata]